jgi:O-succinylbenzoic acid--CoA ligase
MRSWKSAAPISANTPGDRDMAAGLSGDWLTPRADTTPRATAVITSDSRWTYAELDLRVDQFASRLLLYTKSGGRIAALLANKIDYVCLIHASARIGTMLVPLNTRLSAEEIRWQLKRAHCEILFFDQSTAVKVHELKLSGLELIAAESLAAGDHAEQRQFTDPPALEDDQAIIFTSGTTGKPKGARLTYANHFYSATASGWRLGVLPEDQWLCCLPLYHVGGMAILLRSCLYGSAVELHNGFDVAAVSDSLDTGQVTIISLVPTMLHRLMRHREGRPWPGSVRHVLLGGAAALPEVIAKSHDLGIPISATYGLTEASSQVATALHEDLCRKPGSVGKPLLFTRVAIVDEEGYQTPPMVAGEITVSGPTIMAGYDGDEDSTTRTLKDGWLHTGDAGYLDEDGDLWVLQRQDDIIISGGENVYPAEVEAVLRSHAAVADACVVGVRDEEWGQQVAAAVVLDKPEQITAEALLAYCRQRLAGYKLPRRVLLLKDLPQTSSGKIQRSAVVQLIEESSARRP